MVTSEGEVLFNGQDIRDGQNVWQSMGGQEVGSVWGHGAYVAPDWSADWLHRKATAILNDWPRKEHGKDYAQFDAGDQAALKARLAIEILKKTYRADTSELLVGPVRARAIAATSRHYHALFGADPQLDALRNAYAIPTDSVPDSVRRAKMNAFFWASWACGTERPGQSITYSNNWPADALVGNRPTGALVLWSVVSY